ncbi:unnamed protein product [Arctogadus glacialis]
MKQSPPLLHPDTHPHPRPSPPGPETPRLHRPPAPPPPPPNHHTPPAPPTNTHLQPRLTRQPAPRRRRPHCPQYEHLDILTMHGERMYRWPAGIGAAHGIPLKGPLQLASEDGVTGEGDTPLVQRPNTAQSLVMEKERRIAQVLGVCLWMREGSGLSVSGEYGSRNASACADDAPSWVALPNSSLDPFPGCTTSTMMMPMIRGDDGGRGVVHHRAGVPIFPDARARLSAQPCLQNGRQSWKNQPVIIFV